MGAGTGDRSGAIPQKSLWGAVLCFAVGQALLEGEYLHNTGAMQDLSLFLRAYPRAVHHGVAVWQGTLLSASMRPMAGGAGTICSLFCELIAQTLCVVVGVQEDYANLVH